MVIFSLICQLNSIFENYLRDNSNEIIDSHNWKTVKKVKKGSSKKNFKFEKTFLETFFSQADFLSEEKSFVRKGDRYPRFNNPLFGPARGTHRETDVQFPGVYY